jgi:alkyl hydroperoxide reductase subunit AhpC
VLALFAVFSATSALALKRAKEGGDGYDFTLETLDGTPYTLSENLAEKATLLIFWASWSSKCTALLADFQKIYEEHSDKGLHIVAINVEHSEWDPSELEAIRSAAAGVTYTVVIDKDYVAYDDYGVIAVPSTIMLDPTGTVTGVMENYSSMGRNNFQTALFAQLGLTEEADSEEEKVLAYKPKGASARYFGMGSKLAEKRRYKRALTQLEKAVEIDPDFADAHQLLADVYEKLDRMEDAETSVARAKELREANSEITPAAKKEDSQEAPDSAEPEKKEGQHPAEDSPEDGSPGKRMAEDKV